MESDYNEFGDWYDQHDEDLDDHCAEMADAAENAYYDRLAENADLADAMEAADRNGWGEDDIYSGTALADDWDF
jgi:hypothetical protein